MSIGAIIFQGLLRVLVVRAESFSPGTDRWRGLPYGCTTREPSARAAHALRLLVRLDGWRRWLLHIRPHRRRPVVIARAGGWLILGLWLRGLLPGAAEPSYGRRPPAATVRSFGESRTSGRRYGRQTPAVVLVASHRSRPINAGIHGAAEPPSQSFGPSTSRAFICVMSACGRAPVWRAHGSSSPTCWGRLSHKPVPRVLRSSGSPPRFT
jgi:hypothetical protein